MSAMTNPHLIKLRGMLRRLGVNRLVGGILGSSGYETGLADAMAAAVSAGDCVWDVGANVGLYTTKFAALSGEGGHVFAFEPSPQNEKRLREAVGHLPNVVILPLGLSDQNGSAVLLQGRDDLGATSQVVGEKEADGSDHQKIELASGDSLLANAKVLPANVIKIDVEGHEPEVLRGLESALDRRDLRHVFIEVHFNLLESRGLAGAPAEIERMLRSKDFRLRWLDPSHLHAFRAA